MQDLKANTQTIVTIGPFVDKDDGLTPETGITLGAADEAELIKHGSTSVVDLSGATWAAVSNMDGYYSLTLTTSHTDTEGQLTIAITDDSVCLPVIARFRVLSEAAYDSLYAAKDTGYMDVNVKAISEDTTAADNLETACDNYSATRGLAGTALPAAAADSAGGLPISDAGGLDLDNFVQDAIEANHLDHLFAAAYDASSKPGDSTAFLNRAVEHASGGNPRMTTVFVGNVQGQCNAALSAYDPPTKAELDAGFAALNDVSQADITGGAYALDTDANGRIRIVDGTGAGELDTNAGLIAGIAGTITTLDALDTAQDSQHSTTQSAVSGLNDPTAAAIADAVWLETIGDHSGTSGSTAEALNAAGSAGDPWTTSLPGSYTGTQAGKILADVLDDVTGLNGDAMRGTDSAYTGTPPTAAAIRSEIDSNSTQLSAILTDTGTTIPGLIAALNDVSQADITGGAYSLDTDANGRVRVVDGTGAGELDTNAGLIAGIAGTKNTLDDLNDVSFADLWTTQLTESYAANGAAFTPAQGMFAIHQKLMQQKYSGTSSNTYQLDNATLAFVGTLDDDTNPTEDRRV